MTSDSWSILHPSEPKRWRAGNHDSLRTLPALADRLSASTARTGPCHVWTGARNAKGYGTVQIDGRTYLVPRVIFRLANGYWPTECRHTCDYPPCINPSHLLDGSKRDNSLDRDTRGRNGYSKRTHCPAGHEYTTDNTIVRNRGGKRRGQFYRQCRECRK